MQGEDVMSLHLPTDHMDEKTAERYALFTRIVDFVAEDTDRLSLFDPALLAGMNKTVENEEKKEVTAMIKTPTTKFRDARRSYVMVPEELRPPTCKQKFMKLRCVESSRAPYDPTTAVGLFRSWILRNVLITKSNWFENIILVVILANSLLMGINSPDDWMKVRCIFLPVLCLYTVGCKCFFRRFVRYRSGFKNNRSWTGDSTDGLASGRLFDKLLEYSRLHHSYKPDFWNRRCRFFGASYISYIETITNNQQNTWFTKKLSTPFFDQSMH
jgi:hypothetical protein